MEKVVLGSLQSPLWDSVDIGGKITEIQGTPKNETEEETGKGMEPHGWTALSLQGSGSSKLLSRGRTG